ncbi:hypothetical protein F5144DRAFT_602909 [Chaetomium tenue]|uniref:Uncharacterized protein n=1 Tax=Chaetomium tenue TaxID=1854479 RepID=A0ACB7P9M7_9PEZI|nr:hypothetical protein F5144DRAFT_602909 [Chaetomium globosum]
MTHLLPPRSTGHAGTEDPWLLPPESERGGTRPSSFRGVDLDNTQTFNTFVISHHKDNLIEKVEETTPLLGGPRLINRFKRSKGTPSSTESDAWTRQEAGGSSDGPHQSYRISFAELQRMHLRKLQCKLVKHVADMRFRNEEPDNWEADLQAYITPLIKTITLTPSPPTTAKALQDYDYMFQHSRRVRDDFLVTGERFIDSYILHTLLDSDAAHDPHLLTTKPIPVPGPWESASIPIGGTRSENRAKSELAQLRDRVVMALLGGVFLVGPMWLMMLQRTLYTCLVATTVCVVLFGLVMAWLLERPMEVLSGTAAYAAVLVVFVGLNNA